MKVRDGVEPGDRVDQVWRDVINLDRDGRIREFERRILEARARQGSCDPEGLTSAELEALGSGQ